MATPSQRVNVMPSENGEPQTAQESARWHFVLHPSVQLMRTLTSPFSDFMHPTRVMLAHTDGAEQEWRSRSHRKNRYRASVFAERSPLWKFLNLFKIEYWNVSWWVAWVRARALLIWNRIPDMVSVFHDR
jgi:hypothetical protein